MILLLLVIIILTIRQSNRIPFILETSALFVAIRFFFTTRTHIGSFPTRLVFDSILLLG